MSEERVAIVTGSGKGIGRGIAKRLASEGIVVVVNYQQDEPAAQESLANLQAASPRSVVIQADVATPEGAKLLIDQTLAAFGRLDILVNNTGPFLVKSVMDTE